MSDLLGSFPKSVRVRTKNVEKTRVSLWGQSAILEAVWEWLFCALYLKQATSSLMMAYGGDEFDHPDNAVPIYLTRYLA